MEIMDIMDIMEIKSETKFPKTVLKHIVLDIDHTLISNELNHDMDDFKQITKRPHLKDFLLFLFKIFSSVSIWSAGGPIYVSKIVCQLNKLIGKNKFRFVYSNSKCEDEQTINTRESCGRQTIWDWITVKNLKVAFKEFDDMNFYNTMIVDDTEDTFKNNYGNAIHIKRFDIEKKDNCLVKVAEKLYQIKTESLNFRKWENRKIDWKKEPPKEFLEKNF